MNLHPTSPARHCAVYGDESLTHDVRVAKGKCPPPRGDHRADIQAELAEVRAALSHLDGVRALTRDISTGYVREGTAS